MYYLLFKSLHIISMVAWFAGLFYLVRLFVYHTEAFQKPEEEKRILCSQYALMESRLYRIICQPAMTLTWLFGLLMIYNNGLEWFSANYWLHAKLLLVFLLTLYHFYSPSIMASLAEEKPRLTSFQFRLYNEIPSLFLVSITLLAVYRNLSNFAYTFGGVLVFAFVLFFFAKVYRAIRTKH